MQPDPALLYRRYGYGLIFSPLVHLGLGLMLAWIGISGLLSRDGKYDDRSYFEMNASYLAAIVASLLLCGFSIRRMLP